MKFPQNISSYCHTTLFTNLWNQNYCQFTVNSSISLIRSSFHFSFAGDSISFQNSDKIMLYHTSLSGCTISHVKIVCRLPTTFVQWLKLLRFVLWKTDFPNFFLLKVVFSHFFRFKCYVFNNKIPGTKHSHLWNAAKLSSQNTHLFSPAYKFWPNLLILFTHSVLLTPCFISPLTKFQTNFQT